MKIGFDNEKYLNTQSSHLRERIANLTTSFIWSLAESCLTTTMLPAFFPDFSRTANSAC